MQWNESVVKLDMAMRTDRGVVRENNEDAVGGDAAAGLVVLADGMGGANAGEVASNLAVDLLMNQLLVAGQNPVDSLDQTDLLEAVQGVNDAILNMAQQIPEYHGMGTTLLLGLFQSGRLMYAHVGDSRLYRFRSNLLEALTCDHTLIQELVRHGEFSSIAEALAAGVPQNILSRAFGSDPEVEVDISTIEYTADDLFIFCSDGLTNMVPDTEIETILQTFDGDLMTKVDALIERACAHGGVDNVSVILARVINKQQ
jgi:protein phosphatase